ncbi:MAG: ferritin [Deltaproteobacteria bacterium]|jgi:rubrerythrin|nr:ferritin [Deltaproteobacteria bacterium]
MKDYKLYKCQICGDPYLGDHPPVNCPYCGAKQHYFIDGKEYVSPFAQEHNFTDEEKANFQAALDIEIDNASFYQKASLVSSDDFHKSLFKSLKKIESEHASIFAKHLKVTKPELYDVEASSNGEENVQESHRREEIAIENYRKFAEAATTPRAKQVFTALVEIEEDHLSLED